MGSPLEVEFRGVKAALCYVSISQKNLGYVYFVLKDGCFAQRKEGNCRSYAETCGSFR